MPSSALGQVVEAGPQCGETSAELPYVFRILRPAHVPIISARLTRINRRSIMKQIDLQQYVRAYEPAKDYETITA